VPSRSRFPAVGGQFSGRSAFSIRARAISTDARNPLGPSFIVAITGHGLSDARDFISSGVSLELDHSSSNLAASPLAITRSVFPAQPVRPLWQEKKGLSCDFHRRLQRREA